MAYLIATLIGGAVSGAIFSILAMGLVLSYSTSRIFNFGEGAIAFSCAYVFFQLATALGLPNWAAVLVVVFGFAPLTALAWERLVFRKLTHTSDSVKLVATIGILLVMPSLVLLGTNFLRTTLHAPLADTGSVLQAPGPGPNPVVQWHLLNGLVISSDQAITLGAAVFLFVGLTLLLRFTRLGLVMRTSVDRPSLAALRGTNTGRISAIAWIMSFGLAAVAGVLAGPIPGFGLTSDGYTVALFVAATAAIFARLRSIPIAFAGGLAIGAATNLATAYLNSSYLGSVGGWIQNVSGLQASLPYWILLIGLAIFAVERGRRAGVTAEASPPHDYLAGLSPWRRRLPWIVAGLAFFIYSMGPINPIWRQTVEVALATGVVFLSYTVVTGLGGMVSLAQTAFVTSSAVVMGYLINMHGWPFLPALLVGAVVAVLLGIVIALPALRLGGIPLALATLALALLTFNVVFEIPSLTNGSVGWTINRPKLGPLDLTNERVTIIVLFLVVLLGLWVVTNLQNSASGRAMTAVRSSEPAASASAVSPVVTKLTIFAVAALLAGVGGMLLAMVSGNIQGQQYPPNPLAFLWLATVVVFGVRRPAGALLAAVVSVFFQAILTSGIHIGSFGWNGTTQTLIPELLFGAAAIGLANNPDGILAQVGAIRYRRRRAKASTATASPTPALESEELQVTRLPAVVGNGDGRGVAVTESPVLRLEGIHAGYGEVEVLHGIDVDIPRGSIVAVLGPNGSGKSTLCSVIGGLLEVSQGRIVYDGVDVTTMSPHDRARNGLVVVPESRGIFPSVSVDENLQLWLPRSSDKDEVYQRFPNLAVRRRLPAGNLSGGEQQMLSIGPMLVRPPTVLVIDEPTLGIAQMVSSEIMTNLDELSASGTTVILVEERARSVMSIAHWVCTLYRGRMLWFTDKDHVNDDVLASAYMGGTIVPESIVRPERSGLPT